MDDEIIRRIMRLNKDEAVVLHGLAAARAEQYAKQAIAAGMNTRHGLWLFCRAEAMTLLANACAMIKGSIEHEEEHYAEAARAREADGGDGDAAARRDHDGTGGGPAADHG